jgi:hypothetical protein
MGFMKTERLDTIWNDKKRSIIPLGRASDVRATCVKIGGMLVAGCWCSANAAAIHHLVNFQGCRTRKDCLDERSAFWESVTVDGTSLLVVSTVLYFLSSTQQLGCGLWLPVLYVACRILRYYRNALIKCTPRCNRNSEILLKVGTINQVDF